MEDVELNWREKVIVFVLECLQRIGLWILEVGIESALAAIQSMFF